MMRNFRVACLGVKSLCEMHSLRAASRATSSLVINDRNDEAQHLDGQRFQVMHNVKLVVTSNSAVT